MLTLFCDQKAHAMRIMNTVQAERERARTERILCHFSSNWMCKSCRIISDTFRDKISMHAEYLTRLKSAQMHMRSRFPFTSLWIVSFCGFKHFLLNSLKVTNKNNNKTNTKQLVPMKIRAEPMRLAHTHNRRLYAMAFVFSAPLMGKIHSNVSRSQNSHSKIFVKFATHFSPFKKIRMSVVC